MKKNKTLILFTGEFPYGKKGEPFLNTEINYLAKYFDVIYLFPRVKSDMLRDLPNNAVVKDDLVDLKKDTLGVCLFLSFLKTVLKESTTVAKLIKYVFNWRHFLYIYREAFSIKKILKNKLKVLDINTDTTTFYTYWFDTELLSLNLLGKEVSLNRVVSRVHRFDLYDERTKAGIIPFRNSKALVSDFIFAISKDGAVYLKNRLLKKDKCKVEVSYLGVKESLDYKMSKTQELPLIVSCARMENFKRIPLVYDVLKKINVPLTWVHFGDGTEYASLLQKVKEDDSKVDVILKGQVTNKEIRSFYESNYVDLFISASTSEGLPVSMMEAQSYGIPIVGFDVGGISEIIKDKITGVCIDDIDDISNFTAKIQECLTGKLRFNRNEIAQFFLSNFNADINYDRFAKKIAEK